MHCLFSKHSDPTITQNNKILSQIYQQYGTLLQLILHYCGVPENEKADKLAKEGAGTK